MEDHMRRKIIATITVPRSPKLKFVVGNAKVGQFIALLNLPAGHSCPFAQDCLAKANRKTGHITDGKGITFRCYAASEEARYRNVRDSHWHNFNLLRAKRLDQMVGLILTSLPKGVQTIRLHSPGDFFN